jgi:ribosomal protein L9
MAFDVSAVLNNLGDDLLGDAGEKVGLERETAVKAGRALVANWNKGQDQAVKLAAAESGVAEDVVSQLAEKVVDVSKEKAGEAAKQAFESSGAAKVIDGAKEQAMAALGGGGGGFFSKLFGKK